MFRLTATSSPTASTQCGVSKLVPQQAARLHFVRHHFPGATGGRLLPLNAVALVNAHLNGRVFLWVHIAVKYFGPVHLPGYHVRNVHVVARATPFARNKKLDNSAAR